jgi:superfamily II DNA or RNA helicase
VTAAASGELGPVHRALRLVERVGGAEALRKIAASLGAVPGTEGYVAAIHDAVQGDLLGVVSARGGLALKDWNAILASLGGRRRPSQRAIADELLVLALAGMDERDATARADEGAGIVPDEAFELDADAARQPARGYQAELVAEIERVLRASARGRCYRISVATGGGKTRIANDWIWKHALPGGWRVLWLTKDWWLLSQAASDLCRRYEGALARIGYVGDEGKSALRRLDERVDRPVVYTTIHTWRSREQAELRDLDFDAVVIDESHWGEGKRAYRDLQRRYRDRAVFLGLTATPRKDTSYQLIGRAYDYPTLARMGVLARHINEEPVRTGVRWSPARSGRNGDFDRGSLTELATSVPRNRLIARTYVAGAERFGKTLLFACDIDHAEALAELLRAQGIAARAVHSAMRPEDRRAAIQRFRAGATRVLVNVAMMTHGVDIPDIETVFMARPTTSQSLFAQMVGRAARCTEQKTHFRVVDFVDSLATHGDMLVSPQSYFGALDASPPRPGRYRPAARLWHHEFVPAEFEYAPLLEGFQEVAGFDVQPTQTFGVELELTRNDFDGQRPHDWAEVARGLLQAIPVARRARKPREYHDRRKNHAIWNVEADASCGWEVTSRILSGPAGFFEVVQVCRALDAFAAENGLRVNVRTGAHVHLGWKPTARGLERLMQLVACFEPALHTLVAPSRAGNRYCRPIRRALGRLEVLRTLPQWRKHFFYPSRRYLAVNPANLFGPYGTVEVRLHSGTLDGLKVVGWIALWMRMLELASGRRALPSPPFELSGLPLESGPRGDVRTLADFVRAGHQLSEYLVQRRGAVMERWLELPRYRRRAQRLLDEWADGTGSGAARPPPPPPPSAGPARRPVAFRRKT